MSLNDYTLELKRRSSDKFETQTDHDLLVSHSVKINTICRTLNEMHKTFGDVRKEIKDHAGKVEDKFEKIDNKTEERMIWLGEVLQKQSDNYMDKKTLLWLFGVLTAVVLSCASVIGYNQISINTNTYRIKTNTQDIQLLKEIKNKTK